MLAEWVIGLHLLAWHAPNHYPGVNEVPTKYNSQTRGIYFRSPDGWQVGGYHNSYRNSSFHFGRMFETENKRFALAVAGVTGYSRASVVLVAVPSVRFELRPGVFVRLAAAPKLGEGSAVAHLSLEFSGRQ